MRKINVMSLFSGCGGMDLGFEGGFNTLKECINEKKNKNWIEKDFRNGFVKTKSTKFINVFANDIRKSAEICWNNYFQKKEKDKSKIFVLESVVDLVKLFRDTKDSDIFPKNIDVITGGFPCQDFSIAGKRKGLNSHKSHYGIKLDEIDDPTLENRGMLYFWMREMIDIIRPKVFIAENVKGLVNLSNVKTVIENDFKKIGNKGYLVLPARVLNASEYGVPQARERVIFYGFRKDALNKFALKKLSSKKIDKDFDPYPCVTHSKIKKDNLYPYVTVRQALRGLKEPSISNDLSQQTYSKAKWYGKHCQGNIEVNLDGLGPTIRAEHHGNIEFRRLSELNGGRHFDELNKFEKERRLTVRECARLQTFPDEYDFVQKGSTFNVSGSEAYKLIGNAVPPILSFNIAKRLEKIWANLF